MELFLIFFFKKIQKGGVRVKIERGRDMGQDQRKPKRGGDKHQIRVLGANQGGLHSPLLATIHKNGSHPVIPFAEPQLPLTDQTQTNQPHQQTGKIKRIKKKKRVALDFFSPIQSNLLLLLLLLLMPLFCLILMLFLL